MVCRLSPADRRQRLCRAFAHSRSESRDRTDLRASNRRGAMVTATVFFDAGCGSVFKVAVVEMRRSPSHTSPSGGWVTSSNCGTHAELTFRCRTLRGMGRRVASARQTRVNQHDSRPHTFRTAVPAACNPRHRDGRQATTSLNIEQDRRGADDTAPDGRDVGEYWRAHRLRSSTAACWRLLVKDGTENRDGDSRRTWYTGEFDQRPEAGQLLAQMIRPGRCGSTGMACSQPTPPA